MPPSAFSNTLKDHLDSQGSQNLHHSLEQQVGDQHSDVMMALIAK
jgi:hypothetical protein